MKSVVSRNRRWILLTVVAVLIVIGVIVWRLSQPLFVSLGRFESTQVADIAACLERHGYQAGRDYVIVDGDRRIEIAAAKRNEAILALAQSGMLSSAISSNNGPASDYETKLRTLEALKSELRSIIRYRRGVSDIQISILYVEQGSETVPVVASSVITFDSGYVVTDSDIEIIRRLIVGAFPGLEDRHLTLTDHHGRPLGGAHR